MKNTQEAVLALVAYGLGKGLIEREDTAYTANLLLDALKFEPEAEFTTDGLEATPDADLESILKFLLDDAVARGIIDSGIASRDLFDTRLMGCLTPRPSDVICHFHQLYDEDPKKATDYFYKLAQDSDYIRAYRIRKDRKWTTKTRYGTIDITINLSKPEKDPKAIAAALKKKASSYPECLLCHENEGYAGRLDHPARQTIRLIPLTLGGEQWYMQYSPYVYYNEHCIVLSGKHVPMKIEKLTFQRLLEFIRIFPHYTIGSNADLPIVGGSILTHEHFQGGHYEFAMARAGIRKAITFPGYEDIEAGIVEWPMSVIRLDGKDPARMVELADKILTVWRGYSDESAQILAYTLENNSQVPHNTITPIARVKKEQTQASGADSTADTATPILEGDITGSNAPVYELDLVLRNNRTTEEYPLGIFHPHQDKHHIKKENIGLIEVMGLAVLPARLLGEMEELKKVILSGGDPAQDEKTVSHAAWAKEILQKYPEYSPAAIANGSHPDADKLEQILQQEIGLVFSGVLEDAGVYKDTEDGRAAFDRFIAAVDANL